MSAKAIIIVASIIAFIWLNNKFLRDDPEYRSQSKEQKLFSDPLGIKRFRQQPKKMTILTAILIGPILTYLLFQSQNAG